jgi:hypothetical protein
MVALMLDQFTYFNSKLFMATSPRLIGLILICILIFKHFGQDGLDFFRIVVQIR